MSDAKIRTVEFYFDFSSPNVYVADKVLQQIAERTGAQVLYKNALLGGIFNATNNLPPLIRYKEVPSRVAYEQLEFRRFVAAHQLKNFVFNQYFPVNSVLMQRVAIVAENLGFLAAYVQAGLKAMWEENRKMSAPEEVVALLNALGHDGEALVEQAQSEAVKADLKARTESAIERGLFGMPTFFVGEEMYWGKERLGQLEAQLGAAHTL